MAQCESCGRDILRPIKTKIEGVVLGVCEDCSTLGTIVVEKPVIKKPVAKPNTYNSIKLNNGGQARGSSGASVTVNDMIEMVLFDAPKLIKAERERRGMRQVDLAKMLQVKESWIHHIESKQTPLSIPMAKKIEEALDIKLVKKFKE